MDDLRFQTAEEMLSHYQAIRNRLNPPKKATNIARREVVLPPPVPQIKELTLEKFWKLSTSLKNNYQITSCGIVTQPYILPDSPPTWREIMLYIQAKFDMTEAQICGHCRGKPYHQPRRYLWVLARKLLKYSLPQIGKKSGGKDHSTVLHGIAKIGEEEQKALVAEFLDARKRRPRS
jgi:hypothetical protein